MTAVATDTDTVAVRPAATALAGVVTPPGAKSGSVRALLAGALAEGTTLIRNPGSGDNTAAMARACTLLGARVDRRDPAAWSVTGTAHRIPAHLDLDAGNSGIVLRVLAAVGAAAEHCTVRTDHAESLGGRGNHELVDALRQLGAVCTGRGADGRPPLVVGRGAGLRGGVVTVSSARSSQFLTGLLFLAPLIGTDVEFHIPDRLSSPQMALLTVRALAAAGIAVHVDGTGMRYAVPGGQRYRAAEVTVASDTSSVAGLLAAAAAVPGSRVTVTGFGTGDAGSAALLDALTRMGVPLDIDGDTLTCHGAEELRPVDLDGSTCMDAVLPLAALACYAGGTSTFGNVETLRYKECDRISDFRRQLLAAGADVDETRDSLIVHGRREIAGGTRVDACSDHSVVMALAALALRSRRGLTIRGARAVGQTYPAFLTDLAALGAGID